MTDEIIFDSRYGQLTPEVEEKIRRSREEARKLEKRELRCPICGFRIEGVYGKSSCIVHVKCRKCKMEEPLNLAYFRRMKKKVKLMNPYHLGKVKK